MTLQKQVVEAFHARYEEDPAIVIRSPGRVNLMGAHTGYYGGYVLSVTIDRHSMVALRPREDQEIHVATLDDHVYQFDLTDAAKQGDAGDLLRAAAWALHAEGHELVGWEGVIGTDLPTGPDLGQPAAELMAALHGLAAVNELEIDAQDMANIADKAYTDFIGQRSLLAELYSIALSQPDEVMLLDLQSLEIETAPFSKEARILVLDAGVEPDAAALDAIIEDRLAKFATVSRSYKVGHMRDLSTSRFEKDADSLEEEIARQARHFLTENGRTILAAEMMRSGALATIGKLMVDSHNGLKEDYDVSHPPADQMLNCATDEPNLFGARWPGFGSGVIALVRDFSADTVSKLVVGCYNKVADVEADALILRPGGRVEKL